MTTALATWLSGRLGASGTWRQRFIELGYQYAPVAMVSLVIGLGGALFEPLGHTVLGPAGIGYIKGMLFMAGVLWSIYLGARILHHQGVVPSWSWLPLLPGIMGSLGVGLAWWPAIFGL